MAKQNTIVPELEIIEKGSEIDELCHNSIELVEYSRKLVSKEVDLIQIMTFYAIGRWIVEVQQHGKQRAGYGKKVIIRLSEVLTENFGRGFSVDTLENARKFYIVYKDRISEPLFRKFAIEKSEPVVRNSDEAPFLLSWTHYLILMRIKDENERNFYELESISQGWGKRDLQRQYGSSLYERLALSRDKAGVMELAKKGQIVEKPSDAIKDPYVLEFLGLKEESRYSETDLETRIIDHLQEFLMEMGKGFTFVGRQVRFTFDEDHFRVDLVLYNRLLQIGRAHV